MKSIFILFLFMSITTVSAIEEKSALRVERVVSSDVDLSFPNDGNRYPDTSDFELLHYILLSNESGDRFATITLKNTSSGNRIFVNEQLMALLANGKRISPLERKVTFEGKEVQTFTINFGRNKFPVLKVYTRN